MKTKFLLMVLVGVVLLMLGGCTKISLNQHVVNAIVNIDRFDLRAGTDFVTIKWSLSGETYAIGKIEIRRSTDGENWVTLEKLDPNATTTDDISVVPDTNYYYKLVILDHSFDEITSITKSVKTKEPTPPAYSTNTVEGIVVIPKDVLPQTMVVHNLSVVKPVDIDGNFQIDVKSKGVSILYVTAPGLNVPLMNIMVGENSEKSLRSFRGNSSVRSPENIVIDYQTTAKSLVFMYPIFSAPIPSQAKNIMNAIESSEKVSEFGELLERKANGEAISQEKILEAYREALDDVISLANKEYPMKVAPQAPKVHVIRIPITESTVKTSDESRIKINIDGKYVNFQMTSDGDYYKITPVSSQNIIEDTFVVMLSKLDKSKLTLNDLESFSHLQEISKYFETGTSPVFTIIKSEGISQYIDLSDLIGGVIDKLKEHAFGDEEEPYFIIPKSKTGIYSLTAYGGIGDFQELKIFRNETKNFFDIMSNGFGLSISQWKNALPFETQSFVMSMGLNLIYAGISTLSLVADIKDAEDEDSGFLEDVTEDIVTKTPSIFSKAFSKSFTTQDDLNDLSAWKKFAFNLALGALKTTADSVYENLKKGSEDKLGNVLIAGIKFFSKNIAGYISVVPKVLSIASNATELVQRIASLFMVSPRELYFIVLDQPPSAPSSPYPEDGATGIPTTVTLSWSASDPDGDKLTFDLYFGEDENNLQLEESGIVENSYTITNLKYSTTYYWRVVAKDEMGRVTVGPIWKFTTANSPSSGSGDVALLVYDKENLNSYDNAFMKVLNDLKISYELVDISDIANGVKSLDKYKVVISNIMGYDLSVDDLSTISDEIKNALNSGVDFIIGSESVRLLDVIGYAQTTSDGWWPALNDTNAVVQVDVNNELTKGVETLPNWQDYLGKDGDLLSSYFGAGVYWKVINDYSGYPIYVKSFIKYPTFFLKVIHSGWSISSYPYYSTPYQYVYGKGRILYLGYFWTADNDNRSEGWIGPEGEKILKNAVEYYSNTDLEGHDPGKVTITEVDKTDDGIKVKWTDVDADRYEIWRAEKGTGIYRIVGIVKDDDSDEYEFVDKNYDPGKSYTYRVRGINGDIAGAFSNEVGEEKTAISESNPIFTMSFSSEYLTGVDVEALESNGYEYSESSTSIEWKWEMKYNPNWNHTYDTTISSATGTVEYNKEDGSFKIKIYDMNSLKFLLTAYGGYGPSSKSRYMANHIFAVIGTAIYDGVITVQDKSLWNSYAGWWRGKYLTSFDEVKIYNNTGKNLTIALGYLYGNELWFKSGNREAEHNYLLPIAKRWSPFKDVDYTGRVRDNGDAYIEFTIDIEDADEIFGGVNAVNDNGEYSKVYIDGEEIVSHTDNGNSFKHITLNNGKHTVKLFGHKTWSHISPRAAFLVIGGSVTSGEADISPYPYGDPHPLIVNLPQGETIVKNDETEGESGGAESKYPYWIEHDENGKPINYLWVKVPKIPAKSSKVIYIKKEAGFAPNGDDVFEFFDDFDYADTSKWTYHQQDTGHYSFESTGENSYLKVWDTSHHCGEAYVQITSTPIYLPSFQVVWRINVIERHAGNPTFGIFEDEYSPIVIMNSCEGGDWWYMGCYDDREYRDHKESFLGRWNNAIMTLTSSYAKIYLPSENFEISRYGSFTQPVYLLISGGSCCAGWIDSRQHVFGYDWVYVRKYADQEPTVSVQNRGSYYEVTITNLNTYDLEDYQVAIPLLLIPDIISRDQSLKISDTP